MIGKKEFSWSEFKKNKINFLINTAISIVVKIITAGIGSGFSKFKPQTSLRNVFKQVGTKILRKVVQDVAVNTLTHFVGPQVIENVISKVKDVLREGVINYFGNQLKKLILQKLDL